MELVLSFFESLEFNSKSISTLVLVMPLRTKDVILVVEKREEVVFSFFVLNNKNNNFKPNELKFIVVRFLNVPSASIF